MNITLIGMPGSGKSTVGRLLALDLGYSFLDTDPLVAAAYGESSLQPVLDRLGPEAFLDAEAEVLSSLSCTRTVLAPGGSAVLRERGILRLKSLGSVVFLSLPFETLEKRLWNLDHRGVVLAPGQTLQDLYALRRPLYEKYADLTVNADFPHPRDTAAAVLKALGL